MSWFNKKESASSSKIQWESLDSASVFNDLLALSNEKVIVFFKHSTRCSISSMAKSRFEREWNYSHEEATPVYLDLLNYRDLSDKLASTFGVMHQSPQMLIIKNEKCAYHTSHQMISAESVKEFI